MFQKLSHFTVNAPPGCDSSGRWVANMDSIFIVYETLHMVLHQHLEHPPTEINWGYDPCGSSDI